MQMISMHCTLTTTLKKKQVINRTSEDNYELGASTGAPNSFFTSLIAFQPIREGIIRQVSIYSSQIWRGTTRTDRVCYSVRCVKDAN